MPSTIQSIDRVVAILGCFQTENELKLSQIVEVTGLNKSTVHGLIYTLKIHGFIDQDEETQKYRLGIAFLEFGEIVQKSLNIIELARPVMRDICDRIQETVHLGLLRRNSVIYIEKIESAQSIRLASAVGMSNPAYATGIGKVLLAGLPEDRLSSHIPESFEKFTPYTIQSKSKLLKQLSEIRGNGYGLDQEEREIGLECIAFPIHDFHGRTPYAISLSGPSFRMKDKQKEGISLLQKGSQLISAKLGYIPE